MSGHGERALAGRPLGTGLQPRSSGATHNRSSGAKAPRGLKPAPLFLFQDPALRRQALALLRRLPPLAGKPIAIATARGLRDRHGAAHAGSFLRLRRIAFDCARSEFPRVLVHELFHFVWLRAGNNLRRAFENLLAEEWRGKGRGELGWSAEFRKAALTSADVRTRSRRWREYCCESFCDTAAWLYAGVARHEEFNLEGRLRSRRRAFFRQAIESRCLPI